MAARVAALVVGAGVVGLSAAIRLREAGIDTRIVAADHGERTTSAIAAALWYPYRALPRERVLRWAADTYAELASLAEREPAAGVRLVHGRELVRERGTEPWWRDAVPALEHVRVDELPDGYADGWLLELPVADMSRYLPWLERRFVELGGAVTDARLDRLDDAFEQAHVVVNCAGLAAAHLAGDEDVIPVRGQVVLVERPAELHEWLLDQSDEHELSYVVPRTDSAVLGGTAEVGATDETPDAAIGDRILRRCTELVPSLARARILGHRAGIRPGRSAVRVEREQRDGGVVVHCYGHGGAGVTLSWGCAAEVARLCTQTGV